jgi:hypothetical protein
MPIVPIRSPIQETKTQPGSIARNAMPPEKYALMAAAQMHAEGRLFPASAQPNNPPTDSGPVK